MRGMDPCCNPINVESHGGHQDHGVKDFPAGFKSLSLVVSDIHGVPDLEQVGHCGISSLVYCSQWFPHLILNELKGM